MLINLYNLNYYHQYLHKFYQYPTVIVQQRNFGSDFKLFEFEVFSALHVNSMSIVSCDKNNNYIKNLMFMKLLFS